MTASLTVRANKKGTQSPGCPQKPAVCDGSVILPVLYLRYQMRKKRALRVPVKCPVSALSYRPVMKSDHRACKIFLSGSGPPA